MHWQEIGLLWHIVGYSILALVILLGLAVTAIILCFVLERFVPKGEQ